MITTQRKFQELQNGIDYLTNELEYYTNLLEVRTASEESEIDASYRALDMYNNQIKDITDKLEVVSLQFEDTKVIIDAKQAVIDDEKAELERITDLIKNKTPLNEISEDVDSLKTYILEKFIFDRLILSDVAIYEDLIKFYNILETSTENEKIKEYSFID